MQSEAKPFFKRKVCMACRICVDACPVRAMDAGPLDAMQEKYGTNVEAVDFKYSKRTKPAVVFKAKPVPDSVG